MYRLNLQPDNLPSQLKVTLIPTIFNQHLPPLPHTLDLSLTLSLLKLPIKPIHNIPQPYKLVRIPIDDFALITGKVVVRGLGVVAELEEAVEKGFEEGEHELLLFGVAGGLVL